MKNNHAEIRKIPLHAGSNPARPQITPEFLRNSDLGCGRYALGRPFIGPNWYCASLHGGNKEIPYHIIGLQRLGFLTHLPIFQVPRADPDLPPIWRQLFPGYILLNFDKIDRWQRIFSASGVKKFFMDAGGTPIAVEPLVLQLIDLACRHHGQVPLPREEKKLLRVSFKPEDEVRILAGPMARFHAHVVTSDFEITHVRMHLFGRPMDLTFRNADLARV